MISSQPLDFMVHVHNTGLLLLINKGCAYFQSKSNFTNFHAFDLECGGVNFKLWKGA